MIHQTGFFLIAVLVCALVPMQACSRDESATKESLGHNDEPTPTQSNRVAIPASVRQNLGVSFVRVERRAVAHTLRAPGWFEYEPSARREYRPALTGLVELFVDQFDRVEAGDALYTIDSPSWRELQQRLTETESEIERLRVQLATYGPLFEAHEQHEASLRKSVEVWEERLAQLETAREAGGGRNQLLTSARAELAAARSELTSVHENHALLRAEELKASADIESARSRFEFLLGSASIITSLNPQSLLESAGVPGDSRAVWATIESIEVRAVEPGIIEGFGTTTGSWANQETSVLTVVQPERLRVKASGLQSDLGVLRNGLAVTIVPPVPTASGRAVALQETMTGTLRIGLSGKPDDRTLDLYVTPESLRAWARPGVTAQLEIVTSESGGSELAIPLAAVQRDGLTPVIFRRAPDNPNEAIRIEADLGMDDGRWVELLSGVREGDEIVLDGAFQLMLATSGSIQKGGHFHADGTFHEGED